MNNDDLDPTSIEETDQKRRVLMYSMLGVVVIGCLVLAFLGYLWFVPAENSPFAQFFASPTPTPRPTRTPAAPNQTPQADLTATQQAWVKPAESPSLATMEEADAAFKAGAVYLETFASVKPELPEINQPGDLYLYEVPLPGSGQFPAVWSYGWCASLKQILEDNFNSIQLEFTINGATATLDHFVVINTENEDGSACREYAALLTTWPSGQHHLETRVTFTEDVHDGWNLFPAGTHTLKYIVIVE